ncbi:hypothetical protein E5D57_007881 [Metarhizium anisopliae]|nr:hypothetical protein E5D57_007881 [Metarhizium anisopliae]
MGVTIRDMIRDARATNSEVHVKEPLRLQVTGYTELKGIQDALKLVEAFEAQTVEEVQPRPSVPLVRKLKCRLDECDKLER